MVCAVRPCDAPRVALIHDPIDGELFLSPTVGLLIGLMIGKPSSPVGSPSKIRFGVSPVTSTLSRLIFDAFSLAETTTRASMLNNAASPGLMTWSLPLSFNNLASFFESAASSAPMFFSAWLSSAASGSTLESSGNNKVPSLFITPPRLSAICATM